MFGLAARPDVETSGGGDGSRMSNHACHSLFHEPGNLHVEPYAQRHVAIKTRHMLLPSLHHGASVFSSSILCVVCCAQAYKPRIRFPPRYTADGRRISSLSAEEAARVLAELEAGDSATASAAPSPEEQPQQSQQVCSGRVLCAAAPACDMRIMPPLLAKLLTLLSSRIYCPS